MNVIYKSLFLAFICSLTTAFGQSDLSLQQAIEKGLENNYQIKIVALNYEAAQTQNTWGMAGMVPTFSLGLTNAANFTDNSNNPASFFPGLTFSDNLQANVDMSWTIFSGFGIRINKERFDQLESQTKGNAIVVIENTIYEIIIAYYTAVTQNRKTEIVQDLLNYSNEKLAYFRTKSELGISTSFDLIEFENQVLTDSTNLLLQKLNYKNALRNLNLLMAEDIDIEYQLTDPLEVDIPNVSYGELKEHMLSNNQSLQNQFINIQLRQLDEDQRRAAYYPVVTLGLGASPSVGYFKLFDDVMPFSSNTNSLNYYGTISARYTLYNGGQRKRNLQIAEIQTEITTLQTDEMVLQLSHQLRAVFELYQTQAKVEDLSYKRVDQAKRLWEKGRDSYDLGSINVFILNDIKLSYQSARLSYYDRLFDLVKTHYDLMRLTGTISQEYKVADKVDKN